MNEYHILEKEGAVEAIDLSNFTARDDVNDLLYAGYKSIGIVEAGSYDEAMTIHDPAKPDMSRFIRVEGGELEEGFIDQATISSNKEIDLVKVVYVPTRGKPIGKMVTKKVPTGEVKKGFFGEKEVTKKVKEWVQTGYSDCEVDGERFAFDMGKAISELNREGYEVITVTPVVSGNYSYSYETKAVNEGGWGYGYGYGYSYTEGASIIAKRIT